MNMTKFKKVPIMGILRDIKQDAIVPLTKTMLSSGLKTVEITMNTANASKLIQCMKKIAGTRLEIGAGTVLTMDHLHQALDAGAQFIVLPTLVQDVVKYCAKKKIPVFPGALTPQEIYNAWRSGATMVKVFPARFFGPGYFKEIKAPFKNVKLLACGGVTPDTIKSFFDSGASAVAIGAGVFKKEWLARKEFFRIEEIIKELINKNDQRFNNKK